MYSFVTVAFIAFAFAVLVATFFWIANLLARRRAAAGAGDRRSAHDDMVSEAPEVSEQSPEVSEQSPMTAMIHGANYGLVLGILACLLFTLLAPMMLILSVAGTVYSSRALWQGISRYRLMVYRALVGLLLSLGSIGLNYLNLTDQFPSGLIAAGFLSGLF